MLKNNEKTKKHNQCKTRKQQKRLFKIYPLTKLYVAHKIFDSSLVAMRKGKLAIKLNKPAYSRKCILELSSTLMFKFHYDYIKNKYDNKSKLVFTDTDS